MRIRADSAFISGVLFTVALTSLAPAFWVGRSELGFASLAVILVGLIVTWTGYVKRAAWAWAIMFVIVWVWAFPLLIAPLVRSKMVVSVSEWLYAASSQSGLPRVWAEAVAAFTLMVFGLVLPIRSFFFAKNNPRPAHHLSPSQVAFSVTSALVILIALFIWIRVGVLYEIPPNELNFTQRVPAAPPPGP